MTDGYFLSISIFNIFYKSLAAGTITFKACLISKVDLTEVLSAVFPKLLSLSLQYNLFKFFKINSHISVFKFLSSSNFFSKKILLPLPLFLVQSTAYCKSSSS
jgi:hypothetical protein